VADVEHVLTLGFEGGLITHGDPPAISPDGSCVYFTASGVLTTVPNSLGEVAKAGDSNVYLYERDAQYPSGRTVFVMPGADLFEVSVGPTEAKANLSTQMSQNGRFLVFESRAHLTPDDLSSLPQEFEYDSQTGNFVRVSIGEDGFNENGNTGSVGNAMVANDGAVFFESTNPLVPQAVNGAPDVYEYREGSVSLISDGQDTHQRAGAVLDYISPSGSDVFFQTFDQLVPQDTDAQEDTYDARVDGGFPPPPSPPPCDADACQGPLAGAPVLLSPGSEFQAGGNPPLAPSAPVVDKLERKPTLKPAMCGRGFVKKRDRCVGKKARKSTRKARKSTRRAN
jgi:hypothetical protein